MKMTITLALIGIIRKQTVINEAMIVKFVAQLDVAENILNIYESRLKIFLDLDENGEDSKNS
jgi:hypothetical protein